jgi:hypothetical protein
MLSAATKIHCIKNVDDQEKNSDYKPTVLNVFCGAGDLSLGFKNAGCEILGEIDNNKAFYKNGNLNCLILNQYYDHDSY